ncbi:Aldo-keto reductase family 1 member [Wickerhamomyces ciferrii]|uniref:Aldo-keto reductase family 1 member n=1 Tax=Wickerhamomyces ciferrii (strain ATCC 14091 / BCRC 22168 / CBS 111 / JCM 3599 / NBRC 0793 / NRRL Y-1031 F-60-10) TaxID=1206466 RepID=K0KMM1_WICCF|nr:Aldo-keto reductase family 1 member [Wickerhamomyces ciferrii]CCH42619.1 Aldo-keto reductase family 1 member [Wickerhamomyces ciferrii]
MSVPSTYTLKSGYKIPSIAIGVFKTPVDEATAIVHKALQVGYRHIDSAQIYKNEKQSIDGIAKWIKENPENNKREDVFFTTKIFNDDQGYELAKAAIERSLENIKDISSYIDLVLIHSPRTDKDRRLGTWKALQEYAKAGKIHTIGVSNFGARHLDELYAWEGFEIPPSINQVELHPWLLRENLVKYSNEKGIVLEAYAPLVRGQKFDDPKLNELSKKYGKTPAQILIRWSLQKGFVTLPKTANLDRLASNLDVFNFELSQEDVDYLSDPESHYISSLLSKDDPTEFEG